MAPEVIPTGAVTRRALAARTARDGAALERAMGDLGRALRKQVSFETHLGEHPLPWLAGAFAIGLYMGLRTGAPERIRIG